MNLRQFLASAAVGLVCIYATAYLIRRAAPPQQAAAPSPPPAPKAPPSRPAPAPPEQAPAAQTPTPEPRAQPREWYADVKFGLTLAERRTLYRDSVNGFNKARDAADVKFNVRTDRPQTPEDRARFREVADRYEAFAEHLMHECDAELMHRYKLSQEDYEAVIVEGGQRGWPAPKRAGD